MRLSIMAAKAAASRHVDATPSMSGKWLALARGAWLAFFALGALVLVLGVPLHWVQWIHVCSGVGCHVGQLTPQQAQQLLQLGWSFAGWATSLTVLWHVQ